MLLAGRHARARTRPDDGSYRSNNDAALLALRRSPSSSRTSAQANPGVSALCCCPRLPARSLHCPSFTRSLTLACAGARYRRQQAHRALSYTATCASCATLRRIGRATVRRVPLFCPFRVIGWGSLRVATLGAPVAAWFTHWLRAPVGRCCTARARGIMDDAVWRTRVCVLRVRVQG